MSDALDALNGTWSSNWGAVELTVTDGGITGTWSDGSLTAAAAGKDGLAVEWKHKASGTTGKAALTITDDGAKLAGTWGFDDADAGEGDWELSQTKRKPVAGKAKPADKKAEDGKKAEGDKKAAPKKASDDKKPADKKDKPKPAEG